MADLQAAYLWAQLEAAERINQQRLTLWQNYYDALQPLAARPGALSCRPSRQIASTTRTCSTSSCAITTIAGRLSTG